MPSPVEFENYDVGGPEISFHDADSENKGGYYRKDAVDNKRSLKAANGAVVGHTQKGEWLEYTLDVQKASNYYLVVSYASPEAESHIRLSWNGKPLGDVVTLVQTVSRDELRTVQVGPLALPQGDGVLRVTVKNGPVDLDRMEFKAAG